METLKKENEELRRRSVTVEARAARGGSGRDGEEGSSIEWMDEQGDSSSRPLPDASLRTSSPARETDESLLVEMDSLQDNSLRLPRSSHTSASLRDPLHSRPLKRATGTARSYAFDLAEDPGRLAKKAKPTSPSRARSKYFTPAPHSPASQDVLIPASSSPNRPERSSTESLAPPIRNGNPFSTSRQASEARRLLKPLNPPVKMAPAANRRPVLAAAREVINLADSDDTPPRPTSTSGLPSNKSVEGNKQTTLASAFGLGLADRHGRPKKGVVSGDKSRRRA